MIPEAVVCSFVIRLKRIKMRVFCDLVHLYIHFGWMFATLRLLSNPLYTCAKMRKFQSPVRRSGTSNEGVTLCVELDGGLQSCGFKVASKATASSSTASPRIRKAE